MIVFIPPKPIPPHQKNPPVPSAVVPQKEKLKTTLIVSTQIMWGREGREELCM
jgi:hypothetical protein